MANTPINLPARAIHIGKTADGREVFVNPVWYQAFCEAVVKRLGGAANYTISDLASLTFTDGAILVGNGTGLVLESGATARASLGLTIGTSVQAWDADLDALAALAKTDGNTIRANGTAWGVVKNNPGASGSPGTGDDSGDGYSIGSRWYDTTNDKEYVCLDATSTSAVWKETTASGGGSGSLVLLEQHTASNSPSLDFTGSISSTYDEYEIHLINIFPVTDGARIGMRVSTDGGSIYVSTSSYSWSAFAVAFNATGANGSTSATALNFCAGQDNGTTFGFNAVVKLFDPQSSTAYKQVVGKGTGASSTLQRLAWFINGAYESTTAVTDFQIRADNGNLASGIVRVYGVAK